MLRLVLAFGLALAVQPAASFETMDARAAVPAPRVSDKARCSTDGRICISVGNYVPDVCSAIEHAAGRNNLDPHFFARLLWKESLFEPGAISPVGAEGIAQFMPGTARIVGLHDPFNPAEAIQVSAAYLSRLSRFYGSIGIAAVAYNGGEGRADGFMRTGGTLPYETQDYVQAITGFNAWKWREEPPKPEEVDLRLDGDKPFQQACVEMAGNRKLRDFSTEPRDPVLPWGVILASHPTKGGAQGQVTRLNRALRPLLGGKNVTYVRRSLRVGARRVYTAQVGWNSRGEANRFCQRARTVGVNCIVLKN